MPGVLGGQGCPYRGGEPDRRPAYHGMILKEEFSSNCGIIDAALHSVGRELHKAVASRSDARYYKVHIEDSVISQARLEVELLPSVSAD